MLELLPTRRNCSLVDQQQVVRQSSEDPRQATVTMPAVEHVVGEAALLVARVAAAAASTTSEAAASETTEARDDGGDNRDHNSSSPLLFFVALGFGVVFTNLW